MRPAIRHTSDGRYIIVDGRLWRATNPHLSREDRALGVKALMTARQAVKRAKAAQDAGALRLARAAVHAAKVRLGERGPVWWDDGAPDLNRRLVRNSPYADDLDGQRETQARQVKSKAAKPSEPAAADRTR